MRHLSIDLETFSSVPIAKAGAYKYVQSPDFEILLFAYSVDRAPVEIVDLAQGEILPDWLYTAMQHLSGTVYQNSVVPRFQSTSGVIPCCTVCTVDILLDWRPLVKPLGCRRKSKS